MKSQRPDRPLHVLMYTDSAGIGGAEISLGHLAATASENIRITIAGTSSLVVNHIADRRPQSDRIILPDRGISAFLQHFLTFYRLRPDIIHINLCTPWAGAIGLTAALLLPRVKVVRVDQLPLRTTDTLTLWRTRALSLRVDAHVAVGEASARRMEDFYALGRKSVISIPNGVPDPGISYAEQESSPQCNQFNQTMVVGSIGRLDAMKAHDILVQAIAQVEGVRAVILGEGEQRTALEHLAEKLGVSDRVELVGWVNQPHSYLAGFDVVAMPSRSEGFPLAMVEAMLAAVPVIATRVGSMPEAVIDYQTGILIEKDDVSGLVEALQKLRDNAALRFRLGQQARTFAVAHFTVNAMTTTYEHLWQKVITLPAKPRWLIPRPQD
jgi:glycosyltransferase involved in cell wall biosynthesis